MSFRDGSENREGTQESLKLDETSNDDDETKVRLDEPESDNDGDDSDDEKAAIAAAVGKTPDGQPRKKDGKWAEKKAERGRERREAKASEQIRTEYDQRIRRMQEDSDRRFKQVMDEFDRFKQSSGGGNGQRQSDPFENALGDIERQLDAELQLIETDPNRGYKQYNQLRRKEQELITQRAIASSMAEQHRQQQQRPADPYAYRRPIVASEFPWTDDPRYNDLSKKAAAYREYLINVENKPDTLDTDREALATTVSRFGAEFGLRPPPAAPSQRTRSLYGGPPSRGVADRRAAPQEVDLGELGRGTGLDTRKLAAAVRSAMNDEN